MADIVKEPQQLHGFELYYTFTWINDIFAIFFITIVIFFLCFHIILTHPTRLALLPSGEYCTSTFHPCPIHPYRVESSASTDDSTHRKSDREISHAGIGRCHSSSHFRHHVGTSVYVSGALHLLRIQMNTSSSGNECLRVEINALNWSMINSSTIRLFCSKNRETDPLWNHLKLAWEGHDKDLTGVTGYVGFIETACNFCSVVVTRTAV